MIQFLVALALCYVLIKIPFWILGSLRGGGGRSMVGSLVRGVIAYKTLGLIRGVTGGSASPSPRGPQRKSAGNDGAGEQEGGSRGFSVPNPVAAMRRWHQRRWVDPEDGMLPMKLRQPKMAHEIGTQRQSLAEEFDDPDRVMPWQRESPSYTPGLLGPGGGINPNARRERNPRTVVHPERGMLKLILWHNRPGVSTGATPMRRSLAEDFDDPERPPPTAGLQPSRRPGQSARRQRPQQALLNEWGQVTRNARARRPRGRAARPTPTQQKQSQQQHGESGERG